MAIKTLIIGSNEQANCKPYIQNVIIIKFVRVIDWFKEEQLLLF